MDYSTIRIPYIKDEKIKQQADLLRSKYWNKFLPVDIEKIIDVFLRIEIVPMPGLEKICNTNAFITSDWSSCFVDNDLFNDEKRQNRLRFSYAHEIGHFILHQNIYNYFNIQELEDFYRFIEEIPGDQYSYLETQANKFAGYLLIPRDVLKTKMEKELQHVREKIDIDIVDKNMLLSFIANKLSKEFGVSEETMEISLTGYLNH